MHEALQRHQAGQLQAAERGLRKLLHDMPSQPDASRALAEVLLDRGRSDEAIGILIRILAAQPNYWPGHYSLGNALRLAGRCEEAVASYRKALALQPGFAGALHGLGLALRQLEQDGEAVAALRAAAQAQPGWAIGWRDLGLACAVAGEMAEAEAALKRAVALQPGLGDAQRHLAALRRDFDPPALAALAAAARDARLPAMERVDLLFALGRMADKQGQYEAAFGHFRAANQLLRAEQARKGISFDRARLAGDVDRLIAAFPAGFFSSRPVGDDSEAPVFIVGMPRAGSSLFEQIAASHSNVHGAGECFGIGGIARRLGWAPSATWTQEALAAEAKRYLDELRAKAGSKIRIVDKMPDNVFLLGLIACLFPRARVIVCRRDQRDLALSCYFQHFSQPYAFDTDLADILIRIREIGRLAAHWQSVLPLRMLVMDYDALIAAPEAEARRMIEFLGLEWEPGCLAFHETTRPVRTASWSQVRQPLYASAAGRWRFYAGPLAEAGIA